MLPGLSEAGADHHSSVRHSIFHQIILSALKEGGDLAVTIPAQL